MGQASSTVILTTCGTSLLTVGVPEELRTVLNRYANCADWQAMSADVRMCIQAHAEKRKQELFAAHQSKDNQKLRRMSAEINSLLSWYDNTPSAKTDTHLLIQTDTVLGQLTAQMVEEWLELQAMQVNIISAQGLRTDKLENFRIALSDLAKDLVDTLSGYQAARAKIYFNLTGGFKGLNGFIQALSTLYADKTFYLFERSEELLFIPKLPFQLDARQIVMDNLAMFRRLEQELNCSANDLKTMPDTLYLELAGEYILSEWGALIWQAEHKALYQQGILPSISKHVILADDFVNSAKNLTPALTELVNKRIAQLAKYVEGGCKQALSSLDPKPLQQEKYKKDNIWECDLDPHQRIFMRKQGNGFILDKVAPALH